MKRGKSNKFKMNSDLKESFSRIKPVCDVVMVCPSAESIAKFVARVTELKKDVVQELQQYLLFPFITHLKSTEMENKYELQWRLVDGMRMVLEKVVVNSYDMCMKIETSLLQLVFNNSKPGMLADVPEELKHSVMKCLTVLMLNIDKRFREQLLKTQVPLLAHAVFVSVQIAKMEKLRALRLAAINCVTAHTATHPQLTTDKYRIPDPNMEALVVDLLSSILPGVLAALQDVATCNNNPGHAVVVASVEAIHRILCLTMQDKYLLQKDTITAKDFAKIYNERTQEKPESSSNELNQKDSTKRSCKWYSMAGEKLTLITKSLAALRVHDHFKVRKELAVFCSRLLTECTITMQPSMPIVLDILISLSKDEYPVVSEYSTNAVNGYFLTAPSDTRHRTMDNLSENLFAMLNGLPRILNNIEPNRKLYALNLLHGYIQIMCDEGRPQRLTIALSAHNNMRRLVSAMVEACALELPSSLLAVHSYTDVTSSPDLSGDTAPWCVLRHVSGSGAATLRRLCGSLGEAESAELVLDAVLDACRADPVPELFYIMNHMAAAPNSSERLVMRILDTYIEEDMWYSPLDVSTNEELLTEEDTLDVDVYNPRSWNIDSVPGLYEGTVETRYTGIPYSRPRTRRAANRDTCSSALEARRNIARCCLLADGVGKAARRLNNAYQPYLLNTLCLILERIGSKYYTLQQAGLVAGRAAAAAVGLHSVAALVAANADYFTHQLTVRLKKSWNTESALQILSVVLEYSDASTAHCLYGIVDDVLVQSCDIYYENNLYAYLQVFHSFVNCIRKWFPPEKAPDPQPVPLDLMTDLVQHIKNVNEAEKLLSNEEFEKETGKTVEEMYNEDLKSKEDNVMDYDDKVAEETPPLPQHITVTLSILKRCVNFVTSQRLEDSLLAMQVLKQGLPLLRNYENELLPLLHLIWAPLVTRFENESPTIQRQALQLLVTMADLSGNFLYARCLQQVVPLVCSYLCRTATAGGRPRPQSAASALQDLGLTALASLTSRLGLPVSAVAPAALPYLSCKQPKHLQASAVNFFKAMLEYDYGATWDYLRTACANTQLLEPPPTPLPLAAITGSPYEATDKDIDNNIKLIFDLAVS